MDVVYTICETSGDKMHTKHQNKAQAKCFHAKSLNFTHLYLRFTHVKYKLQQVESNVSIIDLPKLGLKSCTATCQVNAPQLGKLRGAELKLDELILAHSGKHLAQIRHPCRLLPKWM